jgi:hypothetical protein
MSKVKSKNPVAKITNKVIKKATKKIVKKTTKKSISKKTRGHPDINEKQEIKEFAKTLKRITPKGYYVDVTLDHPTPGNPSVVDDERNILGEVYQEVINDTNTAPPQHESTNSLTNSVVTEKESLTRHYGVISDVAVKFGCPVEAFDKLMAFLIENRILPVGNIVEYNINIKKLIIPQEKNRREISLKMRLAGLETELQALPVGDESEKATKLKADIAKVTQDLELCRWNISAFSNLFRYKRNFLRRYAQ